MASLCLKDRLGSRQEAWKNIGCDATVLEWVVIGAPLHFKTIPLKTFKPNPRFTPVHRCFIRSELQELLKKGAIEVCLQKPNFISPLNVVPKKNGKFRLICNLKSLNSHIDCSKFRSEDIRETIDMLQYEDYMTSLDLKDCFYHMRLAPEYRDYMGFEFEGVYFRWCVLPFGLNMSPYYCCKIIRPTIVFLRGVHNIRVQVYVDDFLICASKDKIIDHTTGLALSGLNESHGLSLILTKRHVW
jgi:hypothetical protein